MPYRIVTSRCLDCEDCAKNCYQNAIFRNDSGNLEINQELCVYCGMCIMNCIADAIEEVGNGL